MCETAESRNLQFPLRKKEQRLSKEHGGGFGGGSGGGMGGDGSGGMGGGG